MDKIRDRHYCVAVLNETWPWAHYVAGTATHGVAGSASQWAITRRKLPASQSVRSNPHFSGCDISEPRNAGIKSKHSGWRDSIRVPDAMAAVIVSAQRSAQPCSTDRWQVLNVLIIEPQNSLCCRNVVIHAGHNLIMVARRSCNGEVVCRAVGFVAAGPD